MLDLNQLSQQELEQALKAAQTLGSQEFDPPENLQHLHLLEWVAIRSLLDVLKQEKSMSQVH